jgi:hypothetical protein
MGTIVAQTILTRAAVILQDTTNVRWDNGELLNSLNEGQREVSMLLPEATAKTVQMFLTQGTRQSLPSHGMRLIAITRNLTIGNAPGRAVRLVSRSVLDAQRPNWHNEPSSNTVLHYAYDPRSPREFYVYPPQPATPSCLEIVYSEVPPSVSADMIIVISDLYANALLDYILYRAYLKDAEYTQNADRAALHYKAFISSIGAKPAVDATVEPIASSSRPIATPNG